MEWVLILVMGFGQSVETSYITNFNTEAGCYRAGMQIAETVRKRREVVAKELGIEPAKAATNIVCQQIHTDSTQDPARQ